MNQTHSCSKCGENKPWTKFQLYKGKPSGQCRECKTAAMKLKRKQDGVPVKTLSVIKEGKKLCTCCNQMKPVEDFSPAKRGLGGISAYCKTCFNQKYRNKSKAKAATAAYRERHRERHLAQHRVRMFEYRTNKKVTSDGSVTDTLLKSIYGESICYYCKQDTPKTERTVDHKIPLSKGGGHVASNLVMACWGCNCSKRDMSESDFLSKGQFK